MTCVTLPPDWQIKRPEPGQDRMEQLWPMFSSFEDRRLKERNRKRRRKERHHHILLVDEGNGPDEG